MTTAAVSNVATTTAICGGNVTADGGAAVTARGVCWNTTGTPTVSDDKTTDGTGMGEYSSSLTGLASDTTYYVRAYATNDAGTDYGETKTFTTEADAVPEEPADDPVEPSDDPEEPAGEPEDPVDDSGDPAEDQDAPAAATLERQCYQNGVLIDCADLPADLGQ